MASYKYVRKKQKIDWKPFIDKCVRGGGTDKVTLDKANEMLVAQGFVPYEHCHPEFDILKVQGLKFSASLLNEQPDAPPVEVDE